MPKYNGMYLLNVTVASEGSTRCERSLKYFQGIANKKWVISTQWATDSMAYKRIMPLVCISTLDETSKYK